MMRANKLECSYLAITFQSSLTFAGIAPGAYPRRKHLKGSPTGFALALPSNSKTWLERVPKGKASSLLGLIISDKGKSFITLTSDRIIPWQHQDWTLEHTRDQCNKAFFAVFYMLGWFLLPDTSYNIGKQGYNTPSP